MRLSDQVLVQIKRSFEEIFAEGSLYLFGSRVDDNARGGDIDLFIETSDEKDLFVRKIKFLARIKRALGEQRIDVVFSRDASELLRREVKKWAIKL